MTAEQLEFYGLIAYRDLEDGTVLVIRPLTYGRARVVHGVWSDTGIDRATAW